jgi:hypothetical protein
MHFARTVLTEMGCGGRSAAVVITGNGFGGHYDDGRRPSTSLNLADVGRFLPPLIKLRWGSLLVAFGGHPACLGWRMLMWRSRSRP